MILIIIIEFEKGAKYILLVTKELRKNRLLLMLQNLLKILIHNPYFLPTTTTKPLLTPLYCIFTNLYQPIARSKID
jgi:hypothetical protein